MSIKIKASLGSKGAAEGTLANLKMRTHVMKRRSTEWRHRLSSAIVSGVLWLLCPVAMPAVPQLGDLDGDNQVTVLDLVRIANHVNRSQPLSDNLLLLADVNQDGFINDGDLRVVSNIILGFSAVPSLPLTTVRQLSPADGEANVAVTRETVFTLTFPLSESSIPTRANLYAEFGGRKILSRIQPSSDRKTITLFYTEPLPGSARMRVTFDPSGLKDIFGRELDLDGNGVPGGVLESTFDTLSITPVSNTAIIGRVFASELSASPGFAGTPVNKPLERVRVTVDGREQDLQTFTDAEGNFKLSPVPAGRFFVHVDGRTAIGSTWPGGAYYPVVGKAWEAIAGKEDNLAGGDGQIFLPLVRANTLQTVSATEVTKITFPAEVLRDHPELTGVELLVPPNNLLDENGARGGKLGIAPVPPDRLPQKLPPGLEFNIVFTVQSDGPQNFDQPVPVRFPNLADPKTGLKLAPGEKTALWSFNHDLGEWEIVGPATVTADGNFIETDLGVGIRQPGWGGFNPGTQTTTSPVNPDDT